MKRRPSHFLSFVVLLVICCHETMAADPTLELHQLARFNEDIDESSALARFQDHFCTRNDSGHDPLLFQLNSQGRQRRTVRVTDADNTDGESPAQDHQHLLVADIGNNRINRRTLTIYRIAWSALRQNTTAVTADRTADRTTNRPT